MVGAMHDPKVVHRPSSWHVGEANMIGLIPGMDVHWGLAFGVSACLLAYILMNHTVFGFSARIIGGNIRAARIAGTAVGRITIIVCLLAGAAAGLAGAVEIAAVHGQASSSIVVGYGYTGILVAFIARQNPLAVIPVAILLGGITGERRVAAALARFAGCNRARAARHHLYDDSRKRVPLRQTPPSLGKGVIDG